MSEYVYGVYWCPDDEWHCKHIQNIFLSLDELKESYSGFSDLFSDKGDISTNPGDGVTWTVRAVVLDSKRLSPREQKMYEDAKTRHIEQQDAKLQKIEGEILEIRALLEHTLSYFTQITNSLPK